MKKWTATSKGEPLQRSILPLALSSSSSSTSISRSSNTATRGVFNVVLVGILKSFLTKKEHA